jgi:hypothetical protein
MIETIVTMQEQVALMQRHLEGMQHQLARLEKQARNSEETFIAQRAINRRLIKQLQEAGLPVRTTDEITPQDGEHAAPSKS